MASLTLAQIISQVNRKIQNAVSKLGGQNELINIINESNREIESRLDLISAKRTGVPELIMNNIWEYPLPIDISYDKMIEAQFEDEYTSNIKSQFQRSPAKFFFNLKNPYLYNGYGIGSGMGSGGSSNGVGWNGQGGMGNYFQEIGIDFLNAQPYLMVNMIQGKPFVMLNNLNTTTANGTWSAGTGATNVRTDNQKYREGTGSVAFDGDGIALSVGILNSTMTAVDLTEYENKGTITCDIELPDVVPTSITMRWGSSAADYWERTVTVAQNGLAFIPGWNLLGFDWPQTDTGTPVITAVNYIEVFVTNAAITTSTYRLDDIEARLGRQCTLRYYSKYLVISDAGVRKENFTATDDKTMLAEKEVNILVWIATRIANQQLRQYNEGDRYENEIMRMIAEYKLQQPSQDEPAFISYYVI